MSFSPASPFRYPQVRTLPRQWISTPVAIFKAITILLVTVDATNSLPAAASLVATQPSPITVPVGQPIAPITFGATEMSNLGSWRIAGTLPPGLKLAASQGGAELTGPGTLDATTSGAPLYDDYGYSVPGPAANTVTTPVLSGTPTTAGTYTFTLQAYQTGGLSGSNTEPFSYTINVTAAAAPNPGPPPAPPNPGPAPTNPGSSAPSIARQPQGHTVAVGSTVVFNAEATGTPLSFEWRKNGSAITGATRPSLVINRATAADAGTYAVAISNAGGLTMSAPATLTLTNDPNFGHLVNLSIRTNITSADPSFTVGTVVGGAGTSGPKPILVRAVGPSLAALGLEGALADSRVDVYAGTTVVASNNDWSGDPTLTAAFARVGAFPLASAGSKDAAIFNSAFVARDYTVEVGGVAGATGEVLFELYDATASATFTSTTPRLVNVSVRKQIDAAASLTVGFVIGGSTARTVLVRAIGPGLEAFGVSGVMADPQLALFNGQTRIAENDNWGGDPQITTAGTSVGAFAIANTAGRDAMMLTTLAPGTYTVQVNGTSGTGGGAALIEVYEVP
jgi:hypothetical protein